MVFAFSVVSGLFFVRGIVHPLNTVEATADFLVKLFVEVNQPKLEEILRRVQEESGQELPKTGT